MGTILEQVFKPQDKIEILTSSDYMPRVHDVQMPCQWLKHCYRGKCPAFVRLNGNFYCARSKRKT